MPQLSIVTGGTTGASDGTLVSSGNKVTINALSPSYSTLHARVDTAGYATANTTFSLPAELEVSFDGGSTWHSSADNPIAAPTIGGANAAFRIRQTAVTGASSDTFTTSGTYIVAMDDVTGFAASVSGTTVNLSWAATAAADHYIIDWGTDGVTYGSTISPNPTGTSYSHTGRTVNTIYYYRIKAYNADETLVSTDYATCGAGVQKVFNLAHMATIRSTSSATWAAARSGTGTRVVLDSTQHQTQAENNNGASITIDRVFMEFDTSSISAAGGVDEAYLRATSTLATNTGGGPTSTGWVICKASGNSPAQTGDFSSLTIADLGGPTAAQTLAQVSDYAIGSPNSNLTKGGTSRLAVIDRHYDYGNLPITGTGDAFVNDTLGGTTNSTSSNRATLKVSYHF